MRTGKTKPTDPFFTTPVCGRCGLTLNARIMSWFNADAICMSCSAKEDVIKQALRAKGVENAMEGCGFVPQKGKDY